MTDVEPYQAASPEATAAFQVSERIKLTVKAMRTAWVRLAEDLYVFHSEEMWRDLGCVSFEEWIADPDVDVDRRTAYQLMSNWRELVVKRGVDPVELGRLEYSKVQDVLPAIRRNRVTTEEALSDTLVLSRGDLRERYALGGAGQRNGGPDTSTAYDAEAEPIVRRCPQCGQKLREDDDGA